MKRGSYMATQHEVAKRHALLERMAVVFMREGFSQLTMNDLIKVMGVSRRTAYKYFSSKEDIVHAVVKLYLDYIEDLDIPQLNGDVANFFRQFQMLFDQSLTISRKISDEFLSDLKSANDSDYRNLQDALNQQQQQAIIYFETGVKRGLFRTYQWDVLLLQDRVMVRGLIDRHFLLRHSLNLTKVLTDYYNLKKTQLLLPEQLNVIDDQPVRLIIEYFVNEYNRTFL